VSKVELKLPSDPKFLKIIRGTISYLCEIGGFAAEDVNAITVAVDEAASNIIRHTYNGDRSRDIVVYFDLDDEKVRVVLRDFGDKIDPQKIKPRNLDEIRPGGLGVHLIKSTMDVVDYDNTLDVGNRLTLVKYLPGKEVS